MKKLIQRKRTWLIIVLLLLLAPLIYSYVIMNEFTWTETELAEYFRQKPVKPKYDTIQVNGRRIFYASIGADTLPLVVFVHGAPGSWYDYVRYFGDDELIRKVRLVSPDRPGYGNSGLGKYMTSISEQAAVIQALMELSQTGRPVILVGHSYGGPIAAKVAMNNPENLKGLILLAPAIDPEQEKYFAINRLAEWKPVQWVMPKMLLTAYYEKQTHEEELRKMDGDWHLIQVPTCYMYGEKDGLVPPGNVEYARRKLTDAPLEIVSWPRENHFIPWTQQDSVTLKILEMAEGNGL